MDEVQVVIVAEHRDDLFRLSQPEQPMIDENAGELIANGLMQQDAGDRAVDAA